MDDFAEADGASKHFGEHERIERQQQLVVLGELVAVNETDGNELRRLATAGGRNAFDGVEARIAPKVLLPGRGLPKRIKDTLCQKSGYRGWNG
jgi:hypothetical protein